MIFTTLRVTSAMLQRPTASGCRPGHGEHQTSFFTASLSAVRSSQIAPFMESTPIEPGPTLGGRLLGRVVSMCASLECWYTEVPTSGLERLAQQLQGGELSDDVACSSAGEHQKETLTQAHTVQEEALEILRGYRSPALDLLVKPVPCCGLLLPTQK